MLALLAVTLSLAPPRPAWAQVVATNTTAKIGLLQVVRDTLSADPVLAIEQRNVRASEGRLQTASGDFDTKLVASASRSIDSTAVSSSTAPAVFSRLTRSTTDYRASAD